MSRISSRGGASAPRASRLVQRLLAGALPALALGIFSSAAAARPVTCDPHEDHGPCAQCASADAPSERIVLGQAGDELSELMFFGDDGDEIRVEIIVSDAPHGSHSSHGSHESHDAWPHAEHDSGNTHPGLVVLRRALTEWREAPAPQPSEHRVLFGAPRVSSHGFPARVSPPPRIERFILREQAPRAEHRVRVQRTGVGSADVRSLIQRVLEEISFSPSPPLAPAAPVPATQVIRLAPLFPVSTPPLAPRSPVRVSAPAPAPATPADGIIT